MSIFSIIFSLFFAYLYMFSALTKIKKFFDHVEIVSSYKILPAVFSIPLSIGFISLEVTSSIMIIFDFNDVIAVTLLSVLTLLYSIAILVNLLRGRKDLSCGCGGVLGDHTISYKLLIRNALIIIGLFISTLFPMDEVSLIAYILTNLLVVSGFCLFLIIIETLTIKRLKKELLA